MRNLLHAASGHARKDVQGPCAHEQEEAGGKRNMAERRYGEVVALLMELEGA